MYQLYKHFFRTVCFCWLGLIGSLAAQPTIALTGQVLDLDQGDPLAGALVSLTGEDDEAPSLVTLTNDEGMFRLQAPAGAYVMHISLLGYDPLTQPVETVAPQLGILYLARSSTTLEEIVVSATAPPYNPAFKGSNFRIDPVAIAQLNPLSTEEVLRMVPGVNIVGDMGLSNRPNISIRGSWGRRSKKILLLEDGSPAAPAPYVAPGAYYNPVSDRITAIEVYKGADMLRFGPNNMYGAVNYITALPPPQPS
ncbi:MAG: TonB-dependent receptor, partial [Bacteroidetes bacterium]